MHVPATDTLKGRKSQSVYASEMYASMESTYEVREELQRRWDQYVRKTGMKSVRS